MAKRTEIIGAIGAAVIVVLSFLAWASIGTTVYKLISPASASEGAAEPPSATGELFD